MGQDNRQTRDYFDSFSNSTAIRGFALVKHSNSWVEKLFWAILMVGFTGLTVSEVFRTVQNFTYQPTASRFSVMRNLSISLRDPTICVYLDPAGFWLDVNISEPQEVSQLLAKFSNVADILQMLSETATLAPYKADVLERPDLLNISVTNNSALRSLISLSAMMLTNIVRAEQMLTFSNISTHNIWGLFDLKTRLFRPDTTASLTLMKDFYVRRRVPFHQLIKLICSLMCRQMNLKVVTYRQVLVQSTRSYDVYQVCQPSNCYWLGTFSLVQRDLMCIRLNDDSIFQFAHAYDLTMIVSAPTEAYVPNYKFDFLSAAIYLGFEDNFGTRNFELIKHLFGDKKYLEASIIGYYKAVNIRRKRCGADRTYFECISECRVEFIRHNCQCDDLGTFGVSSFNHIRNTTGCGERLATNNDANLIWGLTSPKCSVLFRNLYPNPQCTAECFEECETLILSQTMSDTTVAEFLQNFTVMQIAVAKYTYPFMEEFVSMTLREMVVALGGNLSLYLGASFIALIHIIVFVAKIPIQQLFNRSGRPTKMSAKRAFTIPIEHLQRYQTEGFAQPFYRH